MQNFDAKVNFKMKTKATIQRSNILRIVIIVFSGSYVIFLLIIERQLVFTSVFFESNSYFVLESEALPTKTPEQYRCWA